MKPGASSRLNVAASRLTTAVAQASSRARTARSSAVGACCFGCWAFRVPTTATSAAAARSGRVGMRLSRKSLDSLTMQPPRVGVQRRRRSVLASCPCDHAIEREKVEAGGTAVRLLEGDHPLGLHPERLPAAVERGTELAVPVRRYEVEVGIVA